MTEKQDAGSRDTAERNASGAKTDEKQKLVSIAALTEPDGRAAESYRTVRTSLIYGSPDVPRRTICVTSAGSREGKTTTCVNLAVVLAQAGKNVLLVDMDLRRPSVHTAFGMDNARGVSEALLEEVPVRNLFIEPVANLRLLTAGSANQGVPDLLGTAKLPALIEAITEDFDYVLLDTPPVGLFSDAVVVAAHTDGVLLVVDAQKTRKSHVRRLLKAMENVGAKVIGTVLNDVTDQELEKDAYSYEYGSPRS